MKNRIEILVIDDEPAIRKLLEITLQTHDYSIREARTAKEGLQLAANHPPDLILLDLGLPDESGHAVLQKLRRWFTRPVIILSVQKSETDIIQALDNGANDYLSKPFRAGELLARIRSALRGSAQDNSGRILSVGDLEIDVEARSVKRNDVALKLTATEYALLLLLAQNGGKVLTHQFLLKAIWGPGYVAQSQYLRVYIAQLRKKIEDDPNRPRMLVTESGVGYRLAGG